MIAAALSLVASALGTVALCFGVGALVLLYCPLGLEWVLAAVENWLNAEPRQ